MSTQSVNAEIPSLTIPVTYSVRCGSYLREHLTVSSRSGTLLKVVVVAVIISGLIGFVLRAYW